MAWHQPTNTTRSVAINKRGDISTLLRKYDIQEILGVREISPLLTKESINTHFDQHEYTKYTSAKNEKQ